LNLDQQEIVSVLAYISRASRQAVYILSGRGCVSRANLVSLPIRGNRMVSVLVSIIQ